MIATISENDSVVPKKLEIRGCVNKKDIIPRLGCALHTAKQK